MQFKNINNFFFKAQETLLEIENKISDLDASKNKLDISFQGNDILEIESIIGTHVVNIHSASQEIWLSSPISGPKHFKFEEDKWICKKEQIELIKHLISEIKELLKQ